MTKIIVLNQATFDPQYFTIDKLSRTTWPCRIHPNVHTIHYYGSKDIKGQVFESIKYVPNENSCTTYSETLTEHNGEIMICDSYDLVHSSSYEDPRNIKLIMAYEHAVNNYDFDFIVRVSNTTYVDIPKMYRFFDSYPRRNRVYNGVRNLYNYVSYFVSGFGSYMSRDVVEELVKHKKEFLELKYPFTIEDVAVGHMVLHQLEYAENGKNGFEDCDVINHTIPRNDIQSFKVNSYNPNDNIFLYRFASTTDCVKKYLEFHDYLIKNFT